MQKADVINIELENLKKVCLYYKKKIAEIKLGYNSDIFMLQTYKENVLEVEAVIASLNQSKG
jgi:hypothetical protein